MVPSPSPRLSPELDFERSVEGLRGLAETARLQAIKATQLHWDALWRGIAGGVSTVGQQFLTQTPAVQTAEAVFRSAAEGLADDGALQLPSTAVYIVATAEPSSVTSVRPRSFRAR